MKNSNEVSQAFLLEQAAEELQQASERLTWAMKSIKGAAAKSERKEPTVTGRPFMAGVNEPSEGENIWYLDVLGAYYKITYHCALTMLQHKLRTGELYPTEADCELGEKRKEAQAYYRAMGDGFIWGNSNYRAYWSYDLKRVDVSHSKHVKDGNTTFSAESDCQAAVDKVNERYGDNAFERYVLGVSE